MAATRGKKMIRESGRIGKSEWKWTCLVVFLLLVLASTGCGRSTIVSSDLPEAPSAKELPPMAYSIQVGAFSNINNAIRLTESLENQGLNPYYFVHRKELYKVRFGDFPTRQMALDKAETLRATGIIDDYYIVPPSDRVASRKKKYESSSLRERIVRTARGYIGVPYKWGGASLKHGFDCSGLAMAVYQLNGLNLPRSSKQQYRAGTPVKRSRLSKGDLIFFDTAKGRGVSHVGIYVDDDSFIHAPGRGKRIRLDSLSGKYFELRYVGARTYL